MDETEEYFCLIEFPELGRTNFLNNETVEMNIDEQVFENIPGNLLVTSNDLSKCYSFDCRDERQPIGTNFFFKLPKGENEQVEFVGHSRDTLQCDIEYDDEIYRSRRTITTRQLEEQVSYDVSLRKKGKEFRKIFGDAEHVLD